MCQLPENSTWLKKVDVARAVSLSFWLKWVTQSPPQLRQRVETIVVCHPAHQWCWWIRWSWQKELNCSWVQSHGCQLQSGFDRTCPEDNRSIKSHSYCQPITRLVRRAVLFCRMLGEDLRRNDRFPWYFCWTSPVEIMCDSSSVFFDWLFNVKCPCKVFRPCFSPPHLVINPSRC